MVTGGARGGGSQDGGGDAPTSAHLLRLLFSCNPASEETERFAAPLPALSTLGTKPCAVGFAPRVADGVGSQAYKR